MRLLKSGAQGAEFYQKMWRTILAKEVWRGEVINKRKDGSIYTESATITPVLNLAGDVSHFVAVKEDISQRKQWEADLRSLNEELESRVNSGKYQRGRTDSRERTNKRPATGENRSRRCQLGKESVSLESQSRIADTDECHSWVCPDTEYS